MRRAALVFVALAVLAGKPAAQEGAIGAAGLKELEQFQGTWTFESLEEDGKPVPKEDLEGRRIFFGANQFLVKQGKKIQSQLVRSRLLPTSVVQMVSAGEESGRLGEVLEEVSVFYAKALKDAIKTVTSMIEPIMIILMGTVVGFIAMAIILPIFKMSSLVGR